MKKIILYAAAACLAVVAMSCGGRGAPSGAENPERIFNLATEAMVKGEDAAAIELYYKIVENYPAFKKEYRADAVFRLGSLLYKAERYDEAEKIFDMFIVKHKGHKGVKKAYEMLLTISVSVTKNSAKAAKLKAEYSKLFGDPEKIKSIERTMTMLEDKPKMAGKFAEVLSLEVKDIEASTVREAADFDREFFPVINARSDSAKSHDNKKTVLRKKYNKKYYLFLKDNASNKERRLKGTLNAVSPQWSWDGRLISYTVLNPEKRERSVVLYDIAAQKAKVLFSASGIQRLTAFSPDGSKVAFYYRDRLWLVSAKSYSVGLLTDKVTEKNASLMAWSGDGSMILSGSGEGGYRIYRLARREFIITK